jgi:hypothetical protein
MTSTPQMTGRYIFKCRSCNSKWAKDFNVVEKQVTVYKNGSPDHTNSTFETPEALEYMSNGCPTCEYRWIGATAVIGTLKPEHKCDARCVNAGGGLCECACGGRNHGSAYTAA